tara:strand:+ start:3083 stop:4360 length:1278 start_codon:yes stop_codon:yes gene_type:complete
MLERVNPSRLGLSEDRLQRVSDWLEQQISSQRLAGASVLIGRRGDIGYVRTAGMADIERAKPFREDTIVRIFSMTKPITSVAAMMLYEQGCFQLDEPVAKYLPEFARTQVWKGGDHALSEVEPQSSPMLIKHLFTHTSGLTYGFMHTNVVDAEYRARDLEFRGKAATLAQWVEELAAVPLICQPGTQWNYSVAIDVLGRLVEVWSGQGLAEFFQERIFAPLGMSDTAFAVAAENQSRFAALYSPSSGGDMRSVGKKSAPTAEQPRGGLKQMESSAQSEYFSEPTLCSGGGGLTGTLGDYAKFCQMLLNGGELDGERLLSPTTVNYMRINQLPEGRDMAAMGQPVWSETSYDGIGFGLGFAVVIDPPKASIITSKGEHHWGGAASTFFWIDPTEDLFVVFLTQLMPSSTYPIRRELRTRVYQAIVE